MDFGAPLDHVPTAPPAGRPLDPPSELVLRAASGPVVRVVAEDGTQTLVVVSHELNQAVLQDGRFTADVNRAGFPVSGHIGGLVDVFARSMLRLDDPDHARLRTLVASEFRPRRVQAWAPLIAETVTACRDRLAQEGSGADLVPLFASEIPSVVISRILGLPESHRHRLKHLAGSVNSPHAAQEGDQHPLEEMAHELRAIIDDDLLDPGVLRTMRERLVLGDLTYDELISMAVLLTFGGHETTSNTLALGAALVIPDQELMARLRSQPELLPNAVDEIVRLVSVTRSGPRRMATEDVELCGHQFQAGDGLIMGLHTANRDPSTFAVPDRIVLDRPNARAHLAFSAGLHLCLGQFLAREELAQGFRALLDGFVDLSIPSPATHLQFAGEASIYSLVSLPVSWSATTFDLAR